MLDSGSYTFDLPKSNKNSIIKVIGVGGGGSNAVTNMYNEGIKDVSFVVCNTDAQALQNSPVTNRLQIGMDLTEGLGAGANPEKGKNAAIESKEAIKALLEDGTKMLFITAGMGGGTGSGAAPIIASVAKKLGILTVGIVTLPFSFEGKKRLSRAHEAISKLKEHCDTVLVILNDRLKEILGNLTVANAFAQADNVLTTAAKSIAEIITVPGYVNVDFEDVKTVMKDAGAAVMGSDTAEGEGRALIAAEKALKSPLLDYQDIHGAQKILLSIVSGPDAELQMDELSEITDHIQSQVGSDAELIFGHGSDQQLGDKIRVTVIATGFSDDNKNNINIENKENVNHKKKDETNVDKHVEKKLRKTGYLNFEEKNYSQENTFKKVKVEEKNIQKSIPKINEKMKIPAFLRKKISLDDSQTDNTNIKKTNLYDDESQDTNSNNN